MHRGGPHGNGVMLGGSRAVVEAQAALKDVATGSLCASCGAWRGQLGLEPTPGMFIDHLVEVFAEVLRVLRPDGTLWLNLGDTYATGAGKVGEHPGGGEQGERWAGRYATRGERTRQLRDGSHAGKHTSMAALGPMTQPNRLPQPGLKPKDLVGIPWRAAFALQAAGWWLRDDIIWHKPSCMPSSVTDRTTKSHEYLFLLAKSERYHFDATAIAEPSVTGRSGNSKRKLADGAPGERPPDHLGSSIPWAGSTRNKRSVWTVATEPTPDAHFATFPRKPVEPCILAGCPAGGVVLDPFGGSGTVGRVAEDHGRRWLLFDLSPAYAEIAKRKTAQTGLLARAVPPTEAA